MFYFIDDHEHNSTFKRSALFLCRVCKLPRQNVNDKRRTVSFFTHVLVCGRCILSLRVSVEGPDSTTAGQTTGSGPIEVSPTGRYGNSWLNLGHHDCNKGVEIITFFVLFRRYLMRELIYFSSTKPGKHECTGKLIKTDLT